MELEWEVHSIPKFASGIGIGIDGIVPNTAGNIIPGNHFPGNFFTGNIFPVNVFPGNILPGKILPGKDCRGNIFPRKAFSGNLFPGNVFPGQVFQEKHIPGNHRCASLKSPEGGAILPLEGGCKSWFPEGYNPPRIFPQHWLGVAKFSQQVLKFFPEAFF